jgi:hypothetical protein
VITTVSQNWPNWLALLSIVLIFKGVLERWYRGMRGDQNRTHSFCEHTAELLDRFSQTILTNQSLILASIKDTRRANDDIVIGAIRDMATSSNESTGSILLALGHREEATIAAIEALARAIRDDLASMRTPPPPGGTGSQVKDAAP